MIKITQKLVDKVVTEVAGPDVVPLVKALKNRKNVSEFELADTIGEEINLTRNMLYRLSNANLVSFTRKKDKKKGWYIYYWTFNQPRVKDLVKSLKKKKLDILQGRLKREKSHQFFTSKVAGIRLTFEKAMEYEFKCPETGELMEQEDNAKIIKQLEKEIKDLEREMKAFK